MEENYIRIDSKNAIPVFNFNYSTIMLFRCAETKFSKTFIKGEIHFSQPKEWIKKGEKGNNTQGDRLEGVFLATKKDDNSEFIKQLKENKKLEQIEDESLIHFRNKQIKQCYAICFYGLNDNSFNEKKIDEKGIAHYYSRVEKDYFSGFSKIKNRKEYEKLDENEKTSVVFIYNPHLFFSKIKEKLVKDFGLDENEIIISPVEYIDKNTNHASLIPYPKELLLKDKSYEKQCEIRIIINTKNKRFIEHMKNNNGNINIGSITDICHLYDYYFEDLLIENPKKNVCIYNLPVPEIESYESMTLSSILKVLKQITKKDGYKWVKGDINAKIKFLKDLLWEKFEVTVECDEEGNISISNATQEIFDMIYKENKTEIEQGKFNKKMEKLINNNMFKEAVLELKKEIKNEIHEDSINYYIGKIYEKKKLYKEAIDSYTFCVNNKMRKAEALNSRATCHTELKLYNEAINDLNLLQETIGYNYEIYSNIGVNYLFLGQNDEAISYFNKSLKMNSKNPYAYYNRGVAYYRINNYRQFEEDTKKALEYEPNNIFYREMYNKFRQS